MTTTKHRFLRKNFILVVTKKYNIQITYYKRKQVYDWLFDYWKGRTLKGFRLFGLNINLLNDNVELQEYIYKQGIL